MGSANNSIVFSVENDTNRIVWVHGADGDATKEMFPLCEAIAQALDRKGSVGVGVQFHKLKQRTAGAEEVRLRYDVSGMQKTTAFAPTPHA